MIHKIPIALILSIFFINANYKKTTTLSFLFLFAIMTPIGNWLANNFESIMNFHKKITAIAIGVFLHVSTTILLENSKNHRFNISKMSAILFAIILAYFL